MLFASPGVRAPGNQAGERARVRQVARRWFLTKPGAITGGFLPGRHPGGRTTLAGLAGMPAAGQRTTSSEPPPSPSRRSGSR